MLGKTYDAEVCSIARALEVVGERWSLLIIRDALFAGSTRYSDVQRSLGIATNVLKVRLAAFVDADVMRRHQYSEQPELYEYRLTEKGRDLAATLIALTEWGNRWAAPEGPPILYRHAPCGSALRHEIVCASCGRVDDPAEVQAGPGPGMPAERVARLESPPRGPTEPLTNSTDPPPAGSESPEAIVHCSRPPIPRPTGPEL
ncbi:MAG: winged helix-turn-helix transcriptional regulator [Acidimicrobiales bacterium]